MHCRNMVHSSGVKHCLLCHGCICSKLQLETLPEVPVILVIGFTDVCLPLLQIMWLTLCVCGFGVDGKPTLTYATIASLLIPPTADT